MRAYLVRVFQMARPMLVAMIHFITELTPATENKQLVFNGFWSCPVICSFYQLHDATINYFIWFFSLRIFFKTALARVRKHFSVLSLESKFYGEWNSPAWEDIEYLIQLTSFLPFFSTNMVKNTNKITSFTAARGCLESSRKHSLAGRSTSNAVSCSIYFKYGSLEVQ